MYSKQQLFRLCLLIFVLLSGCAQETVREVAEEPAVVVMTDDDQQQYDSALKQIETKKFKKAEKTLTALAEQYPTLAGPWANRGIIEVNRKNDEQAEKYFLEALKRNSKLVQVRNHLAVLYRKQGRFDEARQMLEAAIAADPYYQNAYYNLGILYEIYLQQPEKALENYKFYLDLNKDGDKEVEQWINLLKQEISAGAK